MILVGWVVLPMWLATLVVFHVGLFLIFFSTYFIVTRKHTGETFRVKSGYGFSLGPEGTLFLGLLGTVLGFLLLHSWNMFDTLGVAITLLQLGISSIALLVAVVKARRKKADSWSNIEFRVTYE